MSEALRSSGQIRSQILAQLKVQSVRQRQSASLVVVGNFLSSSLALQDWRGKWIALYRSLPDEVDLSVLQSEFTQRGARLCYPRLVDPKAGKMEMNEVPLTAEDWEAGMFGILEPKSLQPKVDPGALALIFVPGVAFGWNGERIGRGLGFYDRYLARATQAIRVSLAFELQYCKNLPESPWDQRVDWVFLERRTIQGRRK